VLVSFKTCPGSVTTGPNLDIRTAPESGFKSLATSPPLIACCRRIRTTYQAWGSRESRADVLLATRAELPSPCMCSSDHRSRSESRSPDSASSAMPAAPRPRASLLPLRPAPPRRLRLADRLRGRLCPVRRRRPRGRPARGQRPRRPRRRRLRRPRRRRLRRPRRRRRRTRRRSLLFHRSLLLRRRQQPRRHRSSRSRRSLPRSQRSRMGFRDGSHQCERDRRR